MSSEFRPLTAPRIAPPQGERPTPVNWFERIAARLPEVVKEGSFVVAEDELEPGKTKRISFPDVQAVAAEERRRQQFGDAEPPEILLLRQQIHDEGQMMIGQAFEQAQIIEQEARERGHQVGYAAGYQIGEMEGLRVAREQGDRQRAALRADIEAFLTRAETDRRQAWAELEPQVIQLVFELAKRVIKQEVEVSRSIALSVIRNALLRVSEMGAIRLRVSPEDLDTVRSNREEILTVLDGVRQVEIIEDRRVGAGGVIIETDSGNIDGRIETQIQSVGDTLQQELSAREEAA